MKEGHRGRRLRKLERQLSSSGVTLQDGSQAFLGQPINQAALDLMMQIMRESENGASHRLGSSEASIDQRLLEIFAASHPQPEEVPLVGLVRAMALEQLGGPSHRHT